MQRVDCTYSTFLLVLWTTADCCWCMLVHAGPVQWQVATQLLVSRVLLLQRLLLLRSRLVLRRLMLQRLLRLHHLPIHQRRW